MSCTVTITAGSTAWIGASFADKDKQPAAPAAVSYQVLCITTGTLVRDTTTVPASQAVEIELTPEDTALQLGTNLSELRRVVVTASYGGGQSHVDAYDFRVRNPAA